MFSHEIQIRVRYGETDRMGYLYYGNYAEYYEVARVETIRSLGLSYKELEDSGIALPVLDLQITYVKPAYYDDLLTITTIIPELPKVRMHFKYEISNQHGDMINFGKTTLIFFDTRRRKPCRADGALVQALSPYFMEE